MTFKDKYSYTYSSQCTVTAALYEELPNWLVATQVYKTASLTLAGTMMSDLFRMMFIL